MANKTSKKKPIKQVAETEKNSQMPVGKASFPWKLKLILLLGIASIIVYSNTLKNGFVLDDISAITENTIVTKGVSAIPEILSTPYRRGYFVTVNDLYRPISLALFAAEYQLFGKEPLPFHMVTILLFAGCVMLLFRFLDRLFDHKRTAVAFISSLLFALHPVHTEVVANIKSCDELLCFLFAFLGLNIFLSYVKGGKMLQLSAGALCFLLALLSKETVITFIFIVPIIFFFYRNDDKKKSVYITAGVVFVALIFLAVRYFVLEHYHANEVVNVNFIDNALAKPDLPFDSRIATAILILGDYLRLLFVPYPLISDYSYNSIPFVDFGNLWVIFTLAGYSILAFFGIKRLFKNKKDPYAFGILFYLITLSLFTNIPFLIGTTMGERLLFFPSVGFCFVVALFIEKWFGRQTENLALLRRPVVLGILIPVGILYTIITVNRNSEWKDNYTLFTTDAAKLPDNSRLNFYLGNKTLRVHEGDEKDTVKQKAIKEEEIKYLQKSLAVYPDFCNAHSRIGEAFYALRKYDSAEVHIKKAAELEPKNINALNDLATLYNTRQKYTEAIEIFKKVLAKNPDMAAAQSGLGSAYFNTQQYDSAEVHNMIAFRLKPSDTKAFIDLAGVYFSQKKYAQAIELCKKAIAIKPDFVDPYINIAVCFLTQEKVDSGIFYLQKAVTVAPTFNRSYEFLARAYLSVNKQDSAKKYESIAQQNDPTFKL